MLLMASDCPFFAETINLIRVRSDPLLFESRK